MTRSLPQQVLEQIQGARNRLGKSNVLVGFDGFVDTILHVVHKRESASKYVRKTEMRAFAKRIDAAAGHSANFEFVTQMIKLGGNGPIMANALGNYGAPVTYIGSLGSPGISSGVRGISRSARRSSRSRSRATPMRSSSMTAS